MVNADWSSDELRAAVHAYISMRDAKDRGEKFNKAELYRALGERFGRTPKAFEFRMQNISHVYTLLGRAWVPGLKPAKNVGSNVIALIQELISDAEDQRSQISASFEQEVATLRRNPKLPPPRGTEAPSKVLATATQFIRDPAVVAWVLDASGGKCECCKQPAPFERFDGSPYLEVHHVRPLSDGGSDRVTNAVAICPNCHRELHFGVRAAERVSNLFRRISRLEREAAG